MPAAARLVEVMQSLTERQPFTDAYLCSINRYLPGRRPAWSLTSTTMEATKVRTDEFNESTAKDTRSSMR